MPSFGPPFGPGLGPDWVRFGSRTEAKLVHFDGFLKVNSFRLQLSGPDWVRFRPGWRQNLFTLTVAQSEHFWCSELVVKETCSIHIHTCQTTSECSHFGEIVELCRRSQAHWPAAALAQGSIQSITNIWLLYLELQRIQIVPGHRVGIFASLFCRAGSCWTQESHSSSMQQNLQRRKTTSRRIKS